MNIRILGALGSIVIGVSAPWAQTPSEAGVEAAKNCIRVELMMYSGRPRPSYLVCEDDKKEDLVSRLKSAMDNTPAGPLEPLESTPVYHGLLITQPKGETRVPKHAFVGKGKVNNLDSKSTFRADSNRDLEKYLLDLGESKNDVSRPDREEPLRQVVGDVKTQLDKTK